MTTDNIIYPALSFSNLLLEITEYFFLSRDKKGTEMSDDRPTLSLTLPSCLTRAKKILQQKVQNFPIKTEEYVFLFL